MAAVVAHEVKNPVAGISGVLQVLGSRMPPDGSDRAILGDIQDRIDSLNAIVQDLLLFSRPTAPALASANIRSLLTNTIAMLRCDPSLVDVDVQITGDDPTMRVDSTQLKIVFLHLLLNTAQAMGGRGRSRWPCGRLPNRPRSGSRTEGSDSAPRCARRCSSRSSRRNIAAAALACRPPNASSRLTAES